MNCLVFTTFIICLTITNIVHGFYIDDCVLRGNCHIPEQSPNKLSVDLDQLLKADCRHPLPTDYKQTLRRLDVDLREFLVKDRRNRNHTEIILASSPFVRTTVDLSRRVKCEPNAESGLTGLSENLIGAPIELTCNGYYQQHMPTPYEYIAHFHGQQEAMVLAQSNQYMSFNNGNIMEVHTGRITEGKCKGDDLYVQTVYTNDNPLACIDGSLRSLRVSQMNVKITGLSCETTCLLDSTAANVVTINPGFNNHGLAK